MSVLQGTGGHPDAAGVRLYWLPLGAGGRSVRWNGRIFEALVAHHEHRAVRDLYHSALEVRIAGDRFVIEMTPVWVDTSAERGVVREGPVGSPWLGRFALFRYEVRRWRGGVIPDVDEAVDSPQQVSDNLTQARRLLELVPKVPAFDVGTRRTENRRHVELNSLTAWLLARSGHDVDNLQPPAQGRAPGWSAGLAVAAQQAHVAVARADPPTKGLARQALRHCAPVNGRDHTGVHQA